MARPNRELMARAYSARHGRTLFTHFSRLDYELATPLRGASASVAPVAALRESAEVLYAGELQIRLGEGLVLATGQALTLSVREFELLAALARRMGAIVTRDELYEAGVGARPTRGRSLGRRLREQAARQAAGGDARPAVHPHPSRLRPPLPTAACGGRRAEPAGGAGRCARDVRSFTRCSHHGFARLTHCPCMPDRGGFGQCAHVRGAADRPAHRALFAQIEREETR